MKIARIKSLHRGFLAAALLATSTTEGADPTVGMPATLSQVVIPGPELEVKPIEDLKTPLVVRILDVYPHGSAFRYDLTFYGIKPGTYNLTSFLRCKDGSPAEGLPELPVTITSVLPPGQVEPHKVEVTPSPILGGYRNLLLAGAMLWSAGVVLILYLTRRKPGVPGGESSRPLTLAERLKPLVETAAAGTLGPAGRAELERLLIGYWRRKLGLEHADPAKAISAMRQDPVAGPLLLRLEDWLHRPPGSKGSNVDLSEFLLPYRDIPADDPVGTATPLEAAPAESPR